MHMKYSFSLLSLTCVVMAGCSGTSSLSSMNVSSSDFANGGAIPAEYTCDGSDARPDLHVTGVPDDAKSLAIILHDPDAPNGTFVHWVAWNIDPAMSDIAGADPLPGATQGLNGAGLAGYKGPCPPSGTHHYIFTVYALSEKLTLPSSTDAVDLETAMQGKILTQASLTGLYASSEPEEQDTAPGSTVTPE